MMNAADETVFCGVRHAKSVINAGEPGWSGVPDHFIPLCREGETQARLAGDVIQSYVDPRGLKVKIYTSPFVRAQQTAAFIQFVLKQRGVPCSIDENLREIDAAMWGNDPKRLQEYIAEVEAGSAAVTPLAQRLGGLRSTFFRVLSDWQQGELPVIVAHGTSLPTLLTMMAEPASLKGGILPLRNAEPVFCEVRKGRIVIPQELQV